MYVETTHWIMVLVAWQDISDISATHRWISIPAELNHQKSQICKKPSNGLVTIVQFSKSFGAKMTMPAFAPSHN